ncbi:unnamed protein product [Discula destructiva]
MPSLGSTTLLRGFKVSVPLLDAFLAANCVPETFGTPPFHRDHPDNDPVSKLLHSRIAESGGTADKKHFRVVIPSRAPYNASKVAYVTYSWATVYAHRELNLEKDLPVEMPEGFEELRRDILSYGSGVNGIHDSYKIPDEGKLGVFMVYTFEIGGGFTPSELLDRKKTRQSCDQCNAIFVDPHHAFGTRQKHRILAHGVHEGTNPLPNA